MQSPEKIVLSNKKYNRKPVINLLKEIDGLVTVTAYVSDKRLDLTVQTMYAGKNKENLATPADEQAPANTPEANNGTVLDNRISEPNSSVNPTIRGEGENDTGKIRRAIKSADEISLDIKSISHPYMPALFLLVSKGVGCF